MNSRLGNAQSRPAPTKRFFAPLRRTKKRGARINEVRSQCNPAGTRRWTCLLRPEEAYANYQSARAQGAKPLYEEEQVACAEGKPAEAGRVPGCPNGDPEEAELGAAQNCEGPVDQWGRSDSLYSGDRPQPAGALGGDDPRGACQGFAGCSLPYRSRDARRGRNERS